MKTKRSKDKVPFPAYDGDGEYIFVSYKHADADKVFPIIKRFNEAGFNIWYDEGLEYGKDYDDIIDFRIDNASLFVICITERVIEAAYDPDEYMKKELDVAIDTDTPMFPILLDDVGLKGKYRMQLKGKHSIFRHQYGEEDFIRECVNAFTNHFGIEPDSISEDEPIGDDFDFNSVKSDNALDFRYLDDLIGNGSGSIVLNQDIALNHDEIDLYGGGIKVDGDNLVIDGAGHTIDAKYRTRIFNITSKNITLRNIHFINANFKKGGAALFVDKDVDLIIDSCTFENNHCDDDGGAILNLGCAEISNSIFANNSSKKRGGAIKNESGGSMLISDSQFNHNSASDAGAIVNHHELLIVNSNFDENAAGDDAGALANYKRCKIVDSTFNKNQCNCSDEYYLYGGGALFNCEGFMEVDKTLFKDNISKNCAGAIYNYYGKLKVDNSEFSQNHSENNGKSLYNEGNAHLDVGDSKFDGIDFEEIFSDDDGTVRVVNSKFKQNFNFKYLDGLIHSGKKEIVLDSNIVLDDGEEAEYKSGIILDVDGLSIEGNGYKIDACGKTRIFSVSEDAIIGNITLENGFADDGGAIYNSKGNLIILDSQILESTAENSGGAIWNGGSLDIIRSNVRKNSAQKYGGAIFNSSKSENKIINCDLSQNAAYSGGAIFNYSGEMNIGGAKFSENMAKDTGGAIFNHKCKDECPKLVIIKCLFEANRAKEGGGVWTYNDKSQFSNQDSKYSNNSGGDMYIDF